MLLPAFSSVLKWGSGDSLNFSVSRAFDLILKIDTEVVANNAFFKRIMSVILK